MKSNTRLLTAILGLAVLCAAGCESKREANMKAQQAYMAGQQQATRQWQATHAPEVIVQGPVRNPVVPYTKGLSLADAIVDANYTGFMNPVLVRVVRHGQVVSEMKGIDLLHHHDFPLEAGDIVSIVP